jgi:ribulose-5-phosphate 4-epimerase/fuculose-1-phosphate aldolase
MRVAPLAVVPYFRPGSPELAAAIESAASRAGDLLLRNHGQVTTGATLEEAMDRAEELEETARLWFLLRHERIRLLTREEQEDIRRAFPRK